MHKIDKFNKRGIKIWITNNQIWATIIEFNSWKTKFIDFIEIE